VGIVVATASPLHGVEPGRTRSPRLWDERVLAFVGFVEGERGLDFERPVRVEFLSDRAFKRRLHGDRELTKQDRADIRRTEGQFRALGLAEGDFSLLEAEETYDDDFTVGFYDIEREALVVRGRSLDDIETRVTVVHELVHALQDQHFDLDRLYEKASTSGETFGLDALVEGDATAVEEAYLGTLSATEQDEYYGMTPDGGLPPEEPLSADVPAALSLFYDAPYTLGLSFVWLLDADGGTEARDAAFRKGVRSDEQVIDPVAWRQRQRPVKVPTPKLRSGERRSGESDEFGALSLYLLLASRLDARTALEAATGWGGDRFAGFRRDGKECIRVSVRGDTDGDTDEIAAALEAWALTRPDGSAEVQRTGDGLVELSACEAEGGSALDPAHLESAFYDTLDYRIYNTVALMRALDLPVAAARCVADGLATDPAVLEIEARAFEEGTTIDQLSPQDLDLYVSKTGVVYEACGVPVPGG
jgi:hypothetical protein